MFARRWGSCRNVTYPETLPDLKTKEKKVDEEMGGALELNNQTGKVDTSRNQMRNNLERP